MQELYAHAHTHAQTHTRTENKDRKTGNPDGVILRARALSDRKGRINSVKSDESDCYDDACVKWHRSNSINTLLASK